MSSGPPSEVRLEDRIASGADHSIEVPVYIREASQVDGLELMIDHEGEYLEYSESQAVDPGWSIERIAQYENRRVIIALKRDPASRLANGEKLVLQMIFNVRYAVPGAPPFRVDTALSLGTQSDPPNSGSTHFYRIERGERHPMPTVLDPAMVTIYHQDGIEIGWGDLTAAAQDFTLPVYLTYLRDDRNVFGVGIDYDELFLRVLGVEGISPPLASEEIEQVIHEGRGRTTFELILDNGLRGPFTRLHVANLSIRYTGVPPPDGQMHIGARLFDGDIAAAITPDGNGGGASYGSSIPGVLTILPDHFVRGNVDSSMTFGPGGRIVPAPDLTDALLLLAALFKGQETILCEDAADTNDSGQIEVSDVVHLLNHFFRGGMPPAAPYPFPGIDPDGPDHLGCESPLAVFNAR
jgi:hypothetical protein